MLVFFGCNQLEASRSKIQDMNKEQEGLIDIFSEERVRRDVEEGNLRKKLKVILFNYSLLFLQMQYLMPGFYELFTFLFF